MPSHKLQPHYHYRTVFSFVHDSSSSIPILIYLMYIAVKPYAYTCSGARADPDMFYYKSAAPRTSWTCIRKCKNWVIYRFSAQDKPNRKDEPIFGYPKSLSFWGEITQYKLGYCQLIIILVISYIIFGGAKSLTWFTQYLPWYISLYIPW